MIINHNLSAMFANRSLGVTNNGVEKNMEKLSSGLRINRAGDDASGLAVSEKMRSQICSSMAREIGSTSTCAVPDNSSR